MRFHERRNFGYAVYYRTSYDPKWKMHPVVQTSYRAAEGLVESLEWDPARPFGRDPRFEAKIKPLSEAEYEEWVEGSRWAKHAIGSGWRDRDPERIVVE